MSEGGGTTGPEVGPNYQNTVSYGNPPSQPATPSSTVQDPPNYHQIAEHNDSSNDTKPNIANSSGLPPFSSFAGTDVAEGLGGRLAGDSFLGSDGLTSARVMELSGWDYCYTDSLSGRYLERGDAMPIMIPQPQYRPWESKQDGSNDSIKSSLPSFQSQFGEELVTTLTTLTPAPCSPAPSVPSPGLPSFHTLSAVNPRYPLVPAPVQAREIPSIQQQFIDERHIHLFQGAPGQNFAIQPQNGISGSTITTLNNGTTLTTLNNAQYHPQILNNAQILPSGQIITPQSHILTPTSQIITSNGHIISSSGGQGIVVNQNSTPTVLTVVKTEPVNIVELKSHSTETPNLSQIHHSNFQNPLITQGHQLDTKFGLDSPPRGIDGRKKERRKIRASSLESSNESDGAMSVESSGQVAAISSTAGFKSPMTPSQLNNDEGVVADTGEKQTKKKRKRCGECIGCQRKDNCGDCAPCRNDKSHQICKMRRCEKLTEKKHLLPYNREDGGISVRGRGRGRGRGSRGGYRGKGSRPGAQSQVTSIVQDSMNSGTGLAVGSGRDSVKIETGRISSGPVPTNTTIAPTMAVPFYTGGEVWQSSTPSDPWATQGQFLHQIDDIRYQHYPGYQAPAGYQQSGFITEQSSAFQPQYTNNGNAPSSPGQGSLTPRSTSSYTQVHTPAPSPISSNPPTPHVNGNRNGIGVQYIEETYVNGTTYNSETSMAPPASTTPNSRSSSVHMETNDNGVTKSSYMSGNEMPGYPLNSPLPLSSCNSSGYPGQSVQSEYGDQSMSNSNCYSQQTTNQQQGQMTTNQSPSSTFTHQSPNGNYHGYQNYNQISPEQHQKSPNSNYKRGQSPVRSQPSPNYSQKNSGIYQQSSPKNFQNSSSSPQNQFRSSPQEMSPGPSVRHFTNTTSSTSYDQSHQYEQRNYSGSHENQVNNYQSGQQSPMNGHYNQQDQNNVNSRIKNMIMSKQKMVQNQQQQQQRHFDQQQQQQQQPNRPASNMSANDVQNRCSSQMMSPTREMMSPNQPKNQMLNNSMISVNNQLMSPNSKKVVLKDGKYIVGNRVDLSELDSTEIHPTDYGDRKQETHLTHHNDPNHFLAFSHHLQDGRELQLGGGGVRNWSNGGANQIINKETNTWSVPEEKYPINQFGTIGDKKVSKKNRTNKKDKCRNVVDNNNIPYNSNINSENESTQDIEMPVDNISAMENFMKFASADFDKMKPYSLITNSNNLDTRLSSSEFDEKIRIYNHYENDVGMNMRKANIDDNCKSQSYVNETINEVTRNMGHTAFFTTPVKQEPLALSNLRDCRRKDKDRDNNEINDGYNYPMNYTVENRRVRRSPQNISHYPPKNNQIYSNNLDYPPRNTLTEDTKNFPKAIGLDTPMNRNMKYGYPPGGYFPNYCRDNYTDRAFYKPPNHDYYNSPAAQQKLNYQHGYARSNVDYANYPQPKVEYGGYSEQKVELIHYDRPFPKTEYIDNDSTNIIPNQFPKIEKEDKSDSMYHRVVYAPSCRNMEIIDRRFVKNVKVSCESWEEYKKQMEKEGNAGRVKKETESYLFEGEGGPVVLEKCAGAWCCRQGGVETPTSEHLRDGCCQGLQTADENNPDKNELSPTNNEKSPSNAQTQNDGKQRSKSPVTPTSESACAKDYQDKIDKLKNNLRTDVPDCQCFPPDKCPPEPGSFYTHLGAASSLPDLRADLETRIGVKDNAIRIEKICYTGKEGKTTQGCPLAKWVIRRSSYEEKFLVVVKHRLGHTCSTAWIVVCLVAWEGVPTPEADRVYSLLSHKLNRYGLPTTRRCATNEPRTCACQGLDPDTCGASFSFGCSWSMYYNGCKYARSKTVRKFRLSVRAEEQEVEERMHVLATILSPLYNTLAPDAFKNQTTFEREASECRLGFKPGRPFSGVTACIDFCAHSHRDLHNMNNGCTVVVSLTKHRTLGKPDDEQLHVLPLYVMDDTDEFGSKEAQEAKYSNGSIECLNKFPCEVRVRAVPLQPCRRHGKKRKEDEPDAVIAGGKLKESSHRNVSPIRANTNASSPMQSLEMQSMLEGMEAQLQSSQVSSTVLDSPVSMYKGWGYHNMPENDLYGMEGQWNRPWMAAEAQRKQNWLNSGQWEYPGFVPERDSRVDPDSTTTQNQSCSPSSNRSTTSLSTCSNVATSNSSPLPSPRSSSQTFPNWQQQQQIQPPSQLGDNSNSSSNQPNEQVKKTEDSASESDEIPTLEPKKDEGVKENKKNNVNSMSPQNWSEYPATQSPMRQSPSSSISPFRIPKGRPPSRPNTSVGESSENIQNDTFLKPFPKNNKMDNQNINWQSNSNVEQKNENEDVKSENKSEWSNENNTNNNSCVSAQNPFSTSNTSAFGATQAYNHPYQKVNNQYQPGQNTFNSASSPFPANNNYSYMGQNYGWSENMYLENRNIYSQPPVDYNMLRRDDRNCYPGYPGYGLNYPNIHGGGIGRWDPHRWDLYPPPSFFPVVPEQPKSEPIGEVTDFIENEECFKDSQMGGVAIALGHGSVLFECAKHELHATTALRRPNRLHPTRISLVFYQHRNLNRGKHGWDEWEEKMRLRKLGITTSSEKNANKDSIKNCNNEETTTVDAIKFAGLDRPLGLSERILIRVPTYTTTTWTTLFPMRPCMVTGPYQEGGSD